MFHSHFQNITSRTLNLPFICSNLFVEIYRRKIVHGKPFNYGFSISKEGGRGMESFLHLLSTDTFQLNMHHPLNTFSPPLKHIFIRK